MYALGREQYHRSFDLLMEKRSLEQDDDGRRAFSLLEEGKYEEVIQVCDRYLKGGDTTRFAVLKAAALFHLGRYQEAIAYLRDICGRTAPSPAASLWLARCLEETGSDEADREYVNAVLLDPENPEALCACARYRLKCGDINGAVAIIRRIPGCEDRSLLIKAMAELSRTGDPVTAIALYEENRSVIGDCHEHISALAGAGRYKDAAKEASSAYTRSRDTWYRAEALRALIPSDPHRAVSGFAEALTESGDGELKEGYIRALCGTGEFEAAKNCYQEWFCYSTEPRHRVLYAAISFGTGDAQGGASVFEDVICGAVSSGQPPEAVLSLFSEYGTLLVTYLPVTAARQRISSFALSREEALVRSAAGELFAFLGDPGEARTWLIDGYMRDFLESGLLYARFLMNTGDLAEADNVLLYIARNVRRLTDLQRVACAVLNQGRVDERLKRTPQYLISRFASETIRLSFEGMEIYSALLLFAAKKMLLSGDLAGCKRLCLMGLDVVPPGSEGARAEDFAGLVVRCKERMPADLPVALQNGLLESHRPGARGEYFEPGELTCDEERILSFMRTHKRVHERELRELTGSRRVSGLIGQIMKKARRRGLQVIEREGMSEDGEIYSYIGP